MKEWKLLILHGEIEYIYCKLYKLETVEKKISRYSKSKSHLKTVLSLYIVLGPASFHPFFLAKGLHSVQLLLEIKTFYVDLRLI